MEPCDTPYRKGLGLNLSFSCLELALKEREESPQHCASHS